MVPQGDPWPPRLPGRLLGPGLAVAFVLDLLLWVLIIVALMRLMQVFSRSIAVR